MKVHHLAVVVTDLDAAEHFYAGLLGLPVITRHTDAAGQPRALWCGLDDGAFLALERAPIDSPRRADAGPGWHCVALAIPLAERDAWRARVAAAGHPVERASDYTLYLRDPDGNLVGLSHHPVPVGGAPA
ncbi:MAG: lactoylglutathione lyase [Myxococcales bacterium]|nr:lactoylglutathione lyase [Myxococcales bacterium]